MIRLTFCITFFNIRPAIRVAIALKVSMGQFVNMLKASRPRAAGWFVKMGVTAASAQRTISFLQTTAIICFSTMPAIQSTMNIVSVLMGTSDLNVNISWRFAPVDSTFVCTVQNVSQSTKPPKKEATNVTATVRRHPRSGMLGNFVNIRALTYAPKMEGLVLARPTLPFALTMESARGRWPTMNRKFCYYSRHARILFTLEGDSS